MFTRTPLVLLALGALSRAQTYSATYLPSNAPPQTEEGQTGTNKCGTGYNQTSECQNAYLNSVDDFCLFAPPEPGANSTIGDTERIEVAWCIKSGYGARLIPDGTITGAHFVQTPDYVQITGIGNLTKINIPTGDAGGELDPHGADGNGNPVGGLVFSSAFGDTVQLHEWTNYMSDTQFCFRGCKDGPNAPTLCQHIYDVLGCAWNMPANYGAGVFERCMGDDAEPMGVYGTSTFYQGQPMTPSAHPIPPSSLCTSLTSIGNGLVAASSSAVSSSATTTSAPRSTSGSASSSSHATETGGASTSAGKRPGVEWSMAFLSTLIWLSGLDF
ncbi:hypothetical protein SCP_0510310 [Sparassis crispa]|uniref:Macrofage activating glycoprotein n=1 Tax=Sparassis crispa TaxID=139825 RepID=A0A401GP41_9APHY|nr:hypothetical protein SCP_0510310 [Sparassis crispa]GBE83972.1 hypothetical protein SCP_0510310 [Sparassis crispa]